MIIRCERCSTLYDLDEALLAPEGSPVQCARCQAIFTASPPGQGVATTATASVTARGTPAPPASAPTLATRSAPSRPAEPPPRVGGPGPSIYRPPQPRPAAPPQGRGRGQAGAPGRTGSPPRDAVSAMDARLRSLARWKLAAVPLTVVALLGAGYLGWSAWRRLPDPEFQRQRAQAMALITQDDAASLARALELLDVIQQGDRASRGADGERGLARALLATAHAEEVEPLVERLAAASAEKARLEREQPPGAGDALRALAMEITRAEVELAPRRQKLEALRSRAAEELKAVAAAQGEADGAARGQAVLAVLASDTDGVEAAAVQLRQNGPDAWADLAELWLAVRHDGAARDRAIPKLVILAGAHPELIRARFVLAGAQVSAGRREEAITTVGLLLAANPHHERAQRLRSKLASPPPAPPAPPVPTIPRPTQAVAPRATPQPVAPAAISAAPPVMVITPAADARTPPAPAQSGPPALPTAPPTPEPAPPPPRPAPPPKQAPPPEPSPYEPAGG